MTDSIPEPSLPQQFISDDSEFVTLDEWARRTGKEPFTPVDQLPVFDIFGSDEEYEAFLVDLYASRRRDS